MTAKKQTKGKQKRTIKLVVCYSHAHPGTLRAQLNVPQVSAVKLCTLSVTSNNQLQAVNIINGIRYGFITIHQRRLLPMPSTLLIYFATDIILQFLIYMVLVQSASICSVGLLILFHANSTILIV